MKIAETWTLFYKLERKLCPHALYVARIATNATNEALEIGLKLYNDDSIALLKEAEALGDFINENRFWLGDVLFDRFYNYQQILHGHAYATLEFPRTLRPDADCAGIPKEIYGLRQSVLDYMKENEGAYPKRKSLKGRLMSIFSFHRANKGELSNTR
jgi:hypothetical protein